MKFDTKLTRSTVFLCIVSIIFPFAANWRIPLLDGVVVTYIENGQALWLLFVVLFTLWYIKPLSRPEGEKQFWIWAVLWWLVLLGRSTSWGRVYFPEYPHMLFKVISILLIGCLVLSVVSKPLRKEIYRRLREEPVPLWLMAITVCTFLISDTVEHHRLLVPLFVHDPQYVDLIEELYESPFMIGLFIVTLEFMRRDKQAELKPELTSAVY